MRTVFLSSFVHVPPPVCKNSEANASEFLENLKEMLVLATTCRLVPVINLNLQPHNSVSPVMNRPMSISSSYLHCKS